MLQQEYEKQAEEHAAEAARREAEAKERFENGEISEAEYKTMMTAASKKADSAFQTSQVNPYAIGKGEASIGSIGYNENIYMSEDDLVDTAADLTEEDKLYLAMKWGRLYKPSE